MEESKGYALTRHPRDERPRVNQICLGRGSSLLFSRMRVGGRSSIIGREDFPLEPLGEQYFALPQLRRHYVAGESLFLAELAQGHAGYI